MNEFTGKVAVITGAGRGIGKGIALRCAKEGMRVVLAGIGLESLTKTNSELIELGASTLIVQTDVSKHDQVANLVEMTMDTFGEIHLLVNNAGVGAFGSVWETSLADWEWVMGVNFWGVLFGIRSFLPIMMKQPFQSHIVNVSSLNGVCEGFNYLSSYCASKHAVVSLTESLYHELSERAPQVAISVYLPGQVDTDIPYGDINRPKNSRYDSTRTVPEEDEHVWKEELKKQLSEGKSLDESADILFEGIKENKLYIGVQGYLDKHPWLEEAIIHRAENIFTENNPST